MNGCYFSIDICSSRSSDDEIVYSQDLFWTTTWCIASFRKLWIKTHCIDTTDPTNLLNVINEKTRLILVESPSNPLARVVNIEVFASIAKTLRDAIFAVDNTFLTPIFQNPADFWADVVIHSLTKYISWNGLDMGGVVLGDKYLIEAVHAHVRQHGMNSNPQTAERILKWLSTLASRMSKVNSMAVECVDFLEQNDQVWDIYFTGLENHPQKDIISDQQNWHWWVFAFELANRELTKDQIFWAADNSWFYIAANLGGPKSIITPPVFTTHSTISQDLREKAWIKDWLIRIALWHEEDVEHVRSILRVFLGNLQW